MTDGRMHKELYDAFQQHNTSDLSPETEELICKLYDAVTHLFDETQKLKLLSHVHPLSVQSAPAFKLDGSSAAIENTP